MKTPNAYDVEAFLIAKQFKEDESDLLTLLMEMKKNRIFSKLNFSGIYSYCVDRLGLSNAQANYYQKVAEKSREVPELKAAIDEGTLTLSEARRIAPVITSENSKLWIDRAKELPQKELERAVTEVNPRAHVKESIKPIAPTRSEVRVAISLETEKKLKRIKDVLAQKLRRNVTLEEALDAMTECFLDKHDKVRKAQRAISSGKQTKALVTHQVNFRDETRCTDPGCGEERWTEKHHIIPRAHGGLDTLENLTTLCARHHRALHDTTS